MDIIFECSKLPFIYCNKYIKTASSQLLIKEKKGVENFNSLDDLYPVLELPGRMGGGFPSLYLSSSLALKQLYMCYPPPLKGGWALKKYPISMPPPPFYFFC